MSTTRSPVVGMGSAVRGQHHGLTTPTAGYRARRTEVLRRRSRPRASIHAAPHSSPCRIDLVAMPTAPLTTHKVSPPGDRANPHKSGWISGAPHVRQVDAKA